MELRHSQNFLKSDRLVAELVGLSGLTERDDVFEIGPGKGIITMALAGTCRSVTAIEYDTALAERLAAQMRGCENVRVIHGDILAYPLPNRGEYSFFSNIPFQITAEILAKLLCAEHVRDIFFIMQYEAFLKHAGQPYYAECLRSLLYKPFWQSKKLRSLKPTDFTPPPRANIVFARFQRKSIPDVPIQEMPIWRDFVAYLYLAKGQTFVEKLGCLFSREQMARLGKQTMLGGASRISDIQYPQWLAAYSFFRAELSPDRRARVRGAYNRYYKQQSTLDKQHRNRLRMP